MRPVVVWRIETAVVLHGGHPELPCWYRTRGPGPKAWDSIARWESRSGAERLLGIGIPRCWSVPAPTGIVLQVIVAVLAVLSTVTVVQRFVYVYRVTREPQQTTVPGARLQTVGKVD